MTRPKPQLVFAFGATLAVVCLIDGGTATSKDVRTSASVGLVVAWIVCGFGLHRLGREGPE